MQYSQSYMPEKETGTQIPIFTWAHINFDLQAHLYCSPSGHLSAEQIKHLRALGYAGEIPLNQTSREHLFQGEAFFSISQTGKRIAAYVLQSDGVNLQRFEESERNIYRAYVDVQKQYPPQTLIEKTFQHVLETLSVFKN